MKMTLISTTILSLLFFCFGQIINASEEDKSRWNKRYDTGEYLYGKEKIRADGTNAMIQGNIYTVRTR